jgi:hypothetical protein
MTASVSFVAPVTYTVIADTDQTIVVDVVDTGSDPLRQLDVELNAALILSVIGGVTMFLSPSFTLGVTSPAVNTTRYTLTRTTPWVNPSTINLTAGYTADGTLPFPETAAVGVVCATYELQVAHPSAEQSDVQPDSDVAFTFVTNANPAGGEVLINGTQAVDMSSYTKPVWAVPNYTGRVVSGTGFVAVVVNARRSFKPEQVVDVSVRVPVTVDWINTALATINYRFHVRTRTTALQNPALQKGVLDVPFTDYPALESYRYVLTGALKTRPSSPGGELLCYLRMMRCSLASVASQFRRPDLDAELPHIVPEDLADVNVVDESLNTITILWEAALNEARSLNVDPLLLDLIEKTTKAPYPQERVGAAAALLFAVIPAFTP